jgi:hypothetical protein
MLTMAFARWAGTELVAFASRHGGATPEQARIGVLWLLRSLLMFLLALVALGVLRVLSISPLL